MAVLQDVQLSSSNDELRVPVQRAQVEVRTDRDQRSAVIFLAPESSPKDFFEDEAPFFPAEESGKVRLYARASVVSLVADIADTVPESAAALGVAHAGRLVTVHLRNGQVVVGALMSFATRATRMRTLDLINQPRKSFAVHADGKVHHIAKAHVERIEELV
jgi:hypothetical protein